HMNVVAKNTGYYIKSAYLFYILTFVLILYSTFLTRSGILGETSVHAFTEMGLEWQLVIFIMTFLIPPLVLFFRKRKEIPTIEREETAYSKEFWMFIGSLVLIFSGVLITFTTSIPVYNAILLGAGDILGVDWSGNLLQQPVDVEAHHNKFQLWIGVFIAFLSGMAQFLRYNEEIWSTSRRNKFLKHVGISLGLALAIGIGVCMMADILTWQYVTLMVSGFFVIFTNVDYVITVLRGKIKVSGSAVSHIGFGILLIGVLFSGVKKQVISRGFMGVDLIEGFNDEDRTQNILLRKGLATDMGEYKVTYIGDEMDGFTRRFNLEFERMDESGENVLESFDLQPNILYNRELSKVEASNPSTKHYFHKDIFTHISALPNSEVNGEEVEPKQDTLDYTDHEISLGDTIYTSKHYVIFKEYNGLPKHEEYEAQEGDLAVGAKLEIRTLNTDSTWFAEPIYLIRNKFVMPIKDEVKELGLHFKFQKIDPDTKTVIIGVAETAPRWDYVVLQAIVFPGINLVWLGSIMMMIGLAMSMWFRRQSRRA
ncbi:MAG: cytochrome C biogenesis protein, partial [Bacteroidota bacterium]